MNRAFVRAKLVLHLRIRFFYYNFETRNQTLFKMAVNIEELTKLYYTIGEVAEMFNVSKSLIRFWEGEFDLLRPHKNSKGDRRFTKQNITQFNTIYHLVKERGFTLDGAKKELKSNKDKIIKRQKTLDSLKKIRGFLSDLRERPLG